MAKYEVMFSMEAEAKDSGIIENFLTGYGIDYTLRRIRDGYHEYGFLKGLNPDNISEPLTIVAAELQPYDGEHHVFPVNIKMSDDSVKVVEISSDEFMSSCTSYFGDTPRVGTPTATEDMEPYDFNTNLINDFIQFLLPYNVDAKAQGVILDILGKTLDFCGDIRNGKSDISDNTTYSIEFNKNRSENTK